MAATLTTTMQIVFRDCPPLNVQVNPGLGRRWLALVESTYTKDPQAIFRDPQKYTTELLAKLASEANQRLGWNWDTTDLSVAATTLMHKDIEEFLAQGFENIPEEFDQLLHDIHFCLHSVESGSKRNSWLQVEWFNDSGFSITADEYPGRLNTRFGDIRLQNPYVGHHPLYLFQQRDSINIMQTCRFHDFVKPGICIVVQPETNNLCLSEYIKWFQQHSPEFIDQHSLENLVKFTGHPVVGRITNLEDLQYCVQKEYLEFDRLEFNHSD